MNHLPAMSNTLVSVGNLESYIQYVNQIPLLTLEEEKDLTERLFNSNDLDAAKRLILSHLRFVVRVAQRYTGYGLALADLIQEGNIGLMKAVRRFDPKVGVRLVTFAIHWVKAEIHEFILRNWRIVKIATTKAQRKLFFNLRSAKKRAGAFTAKEAAAIAEEFGVTSEEVREMDMRMSASDTSFDYTSNEENDESSTKLVPAHYLKDERYNPAIEFEIEDSTQKSQNALEQALTKLDSRSYDIVKKRWLNSEKATLEELANQYKISAERIRQLEQAAMKKLKHILTPS